MYVIMIGFQLNVYGWRVISGDLQFHAQFTRVYG